MPKFIIRNFQSIREAKLDVSGFTLLIGESSAGKSAFFRALRAAVYNRFSSGQVRSGCPAAQVCFQYSPDSSLSVVKSESGSPTMHLQTPTGPLDFSKLSRTVPLPVSQFHNLDPILDGSSPYSLNFHSQFQPPFLLNFSQRRVLELLSASSSLSDLALLKDSLYEKRAENRGAFQSLDSILTSLKTRHSSLSSRVASLTSPVSSLRSDYSSLQSVESRVASLQSLSDAYLKLVTLRSLVERYSSLVSTLQSLSSLDQRLSHCATLVSLHQSLSSSRSSLPPLQSVVSSLQDLVRINSQRTSLTALSSNSSQLSVLNARLAEVRPIVEDHICPICKTPLSDGHLH